MVEGERLLTYALCHITSLPISPLIIYQTYPDLGTHLSFVLLIHFIHFPIFATSILFSCLALFDTFLVFVVGSGLVDWKNRLGILGVQALVVFCFGFDIVGGLGGWDFSLCFYFL